MSYTPPTGNNVPLIFDGYYSPPLGSAVTLNFDLAPQLVFVATLTATLDAFSLDAIAYQSNPCICDVLLDDITGAVPVILSYPATLAASFEDISGAIQIIMSYPATLAAMLSDITLTALAQQGTQGACVALLDDLSCSSIADWQAGVWRGLEFSRSGADQAGQNLFVQTSAPHRQSTRYHTELSSPLMPADLLNNDKAMTWVDVEHKPLKTDVNWELGTPYVQQRSNSYTASPPRHLNRTNDWARATATETECRSPYISPKAKPKAWRIDVGTGRDLSLHTREWQLIYGIADFFKKQYKIPWEVATPHSWIWGGWHYPPDPPPTVYIPSTLLRFYQREPDFIGGAILQFGKPCFAWPIDYHRTDPHGNYTIMLHTIHVKRLPDLLEIPVLSVSLKFDSESWAWGASLNLKTAETMDLLATVNGEPRQVQIELDGFYLVSLIEEWGESRVFGETSYTASGRSPLALFAYPYAPLRSHLEADAKTAAQLIDFELLNTGWTTAYDTTLTQLFTTDWLVPGGAWSYQNKSPIDCIVQIARAVGARAYSDHTANLVHIAPRYPVNPWDWADVEEVDQTIPLNLIRSMSTQLNTQPTYNQVIVSGQSHGVTVSASIEGSGGTMTAPMITDNLITYVNAGRERARNVLSNTGKQARVTLELPMNATTGLLEPGQLVEVSETIPWRGLVTSVSVTANHGTISQSVEIERHYQ